MFHDSQASASRRSSVQDVADHTSADTPPWAAIACRTATPEARIWARGPVPEGRSSPGSPEPEPEPEPEPDPEPEPEPGAAPYRYSPRRMPCSRAAGPPGNDKGSAGCGYGSL